MTNKHKTTIYVGVTSDLIKRVAEHKTHKFNASFTARYNLEYCVYYECFDSIVVAIAREKEIKKWRREKKDNLINSKNPEWKEVVDDKRFILELK